MEFESASDMETKEFCGAAWPSKVKESEGILSAPLLPPKIHHPSPSNPRPVVLNRVELGGFRSRRIHSSPRGTTPAVI